MDNPSSPLETLRQLKEMLDAGALTPSEFEALKKRLVFTDPASPQAPPAPAVTPPAAPLSTPPAYSPSPSASVPPAPPASVPPAAVPPVAPPPTPSSQLIVELNTPVASQGPTTPVPIRTVPAEPAPPIAGPPPFPPRIPQPPVSPISQAIVDSLGKTPTGGAASAAPVFPSSPPVTPVPPVAPRVPQSAMPPPIAPVPPPVAPAPPPREPVVDQGWTDNEFPESETPKARSPLALILSIGGLLALLGLVVYLSMNRPPSERITSTSQTAADTVATAIETGPQAEPLPQTESVPETIRVMPTNPAPAVPARPVQPRPAPAVRDSVMESTAAPSDSVETP